MEFAFGRHQTCCDACSIFRFGPKTKANYAWNQSKFNRAAPYAANALHSCQLMNESLSLTRKLIHLTQPGAWWYANRSQRHRLQYRAHILVSLSISFFLSQFNRHRHTCTTNDVTFGDFIYDTCVLTTKQHASLFIIYLFSIQMRNFATIFRMSILQRSNWTDSIWEKLINIKHFCRLTTLDVKSIWWILTLCIKYDF